MNRQDAVRLISETFQNPFDENRFRLFTRNLFNDLDESKSFDYYGQYIPDAYKDHVKRFKRIGKYTDPENTSLDILIVSLKKEAALDSARTMQRNFIAWYLKHRGEKEAALVAYHTDGLEDWRFSFVRMDYRTVEEGNKVKVKEELTPVRRYSFLVGQNEPNHTAQQQLLPILQNDRSNPCLLELERAFNIESVTKEFFEKYKNLFLKVKEDLDEVVISNHKVKNDFTLKKIETADFAKKLLGQIVFLYFLQKKGWLGVEKDETGNFKGWGTGPKDFLRRLYEKRIVPYDNFFNDLLEPLFYEALAIDRGVKSFYSPFKCKIPFLNGGLFEPIGGYNWQETDILLKNETFAEIFNTFDLYNFTVREDEPLEKEVAVDPEMLGKVFENLLEIKDRKSKGAFYTPREIVHYMCQESLINYLDTGVNVKEINLASQEKIQNKLFGSPEPEQLGIKAETYHIRIPREDIEFFIRHGEYGVENDVAKKRGTKSYSYQLPESIRTNAGILDSLLSNIKICDPAIGSGAFPVGMLHEIVTAREILTAYLGEFIGRTRYDFKRHAIQDSIYGVDIEGSAVDIAKLRLWLSLVVDEDDFETIKPLPNLDYKIITGNSLLEIKKDLLYNSLSMELEELKQQFFDETNPRKKNERKGKIEKLISKLTHDDGHFDFEIYFSEVFHQKGGFDIIIGNPPYLNLTTNSYDKALLKFYKKNYKVLDDAQSKNLFTLFIEKGIRLTNHNSSIAMIVPEGLANTKSYTSVRNLFNQELRLDSLLFFKDFVFENAMIGSLVFIASNKPNDVVFVRTAKSKNRIVELAKLEYSKILESPSLEWLTMDAADDLFSKISNLSVPLSKIFNFSKGMVVKNREEHLRPTKSKKNELPFLLGKNIDRYVLKYTNYTTYDELEIVGGTKVLSKHLITPRVLIRRTGDKLCLTYSDKPELIESTLYIMTGQNEAALKEALGILNSKLLSYYAKHKFITNPQAFPQIVLSNLSALPLKTFNDAVQKKRFLALVDQILSLKQVNADVDTSALEAEINKMVYALFGLTDEEIALVENSTQS